MDLADQVTEQEEMMLASSLYRSKRDVPETVATGVCLFCDEPVEPPRRWCNSQCRDDWELVNRAD